MMARSRNIKPGFFSNEHLAEVDFATRLLFIGMWTEADREGRLEDRPRRLKMALFPADNVDIEKMLADLDHLGFITRYTVGSFKAIQIVNWSKHQNPHVKEAKSVIPEMPGLEASEGEHGASPVQAPDKNSSFPADSLSLDSGFLIPDSLSPSPAPVVTEDLFPNFWKLYPRKVGKDKAEKAWAKLKVTQGLYDLMVAALAKQVLTPDWTKERGQFIPHPATWLNGKRWQDEIPELASNVHPFPQSRHTGFADRDYTSGLKQREDGSYAL
ncbi:DnaT domain-containing protein [Pseudomonas sp. IT-P2]